MPSRQNRKRIPSIAVQGEDSYVVFRRYEYGEQKALAAHTRELQAAHEKAVAEAKRDGGPPPDPPDLNALGLADMADHIIDWNWVDDEGKPLPLPSADATVWDRLTDDEMAWLEKKLLGPSEADLKN